MTYTGYFNNTPYIVVDGRTIYGRDLNNPMAAISAGVATLASDIQTGQRIRTAADTGTANVYVMNLTVIPLSLADGLEVWLKPAATNSGPATLNLNSFGVKSIRNPDGSVLSGGELTAGYYSNLKYNGTYWQITSNTARNVVDETLVTSSVATIAELQGVSPLASAVYVEAMATPGDGGGGYFQWIGENLAAAVTADNLHGVYVPPTSDTTGENGAWVRQFSGGVMPEWWGSNTNPGTTNMYTAFQAALNFIIPTGGTVLLGNTNYYIGTTLDLHNFNSDTSQPLVDNSITIKGMGKRQTFIIGGEASYGFIDAVGANYVNIEGLSLSSTTTTQFGILLGRTTGDGNAGNHRIKDVGIYGSYTLAGIFAMSSELCTYDDLHVYTSGGKGIVLARDLTGWTVTPKYGTLSATTPLQVGNTGNRITNTNIWSNSSTDGNYLLVLEAAHRFYSHNLYVWSSAQSNQIHFDKGGYGYTFDALIAEKSGAEPWTFDFVFYLASQTYPQYRDISIRGGDTYGIYTDSNIGGIENLQVSGTIKGAKSPIVDIYSLYDSAIIAKPLYGTTPAYRIRKVSLRNSFGPGITETYSEVTATLNTATGKAFIADSSVDFSKYAGRLITISDGAQTATGYVKSSGSGRTYDTTIVTNGTFDSNTTGWTPQQCTIASVAGGKSNNCMQVTTVSGAYQWAYAPITLASGKLYEASAWVKSGTSGDQLALLEIDSTVIGSKTTSNTWELLRSNLFGGSGAVSLKAFKYTATAGTMLFDEISVREVLTPGEKDASIVSSQYGDEYNWKTDSGINTGAASYAVTVSP